LTPDLIAKEEKNTSLQMDWCFARRFSGDESIISSKRGIPRRAPEFFGSDGMSGLKPD
jgi:hypothetical protein